MPPKLADIVVQAIGQDLGSVFPGNPVKNASRKRPFVIPVGYRTMVIFIVAAVVLLAILTDLSFTHLKRRPGKRVAANLASGEELVAGVDSILAHAAEQRAPRSTILTAQALCTA
jgi:hypothetical protein